VGAYAFNRYVRDNLRHLYYNAWNERAQMWHEASIVTVGNPLARVVNGAYYNTYIMRQDAPADGDTFTHAFCIAPGFYYKFYVEGLTGTAQGKLDIFVDDVYLNTIDMYAASSTPVSHYSGPFFTGRGLRHVLTGVVNGKNAGSSNYYISLSKIFLVPLEEGDL